MNHRALFKNFHFLLWVASDIGNILDIEELHEFHSIDPELSDLSTVSGELWVYHQCLRQIDSLPNNAMEALSTADKDIYPNIIAF